MNREKCKAILPVIQDFANGEHIEYYDPFHIWENERGRGAWKTADNIGFGQPVNYYRKKVGERYVYYDTTKKYLHYELI